MKNYELFYIDGQWVKPEGRQVLEVLKPATEEAFATISLGAADDVDRAVSAAQRAFPAFSQTSQAECVDLLIAITNDTVYGLTNYVSSGDRDRACRLARRLRSGMVHINAAPGDYNCAFGGYKQSGNGREWGKYGFADFMAIKSIFGFH